MTTTIYFDMDGTIADLYGVDNWLYYLESENVLPYAVAAPLLRLCALARVLNRLQRDGYRIGVISWLSRGGSDEYNVAVAEVKREWLRKHLASVNFDEVNIVNYGTPKQNFATSESDILFDDEARNRENWTGRAFDVNNIMEILKTL